MPNCEVSTWSTTKCPKCALPSHVTALRWLIDHAAEIPLEPSSISAGSLVRDAVCLTDTQRLPSPVQRYFALTVATVGSVLSILTVPTTCAQVGCGVFAFATGPQSA